MAEPYIMQFLDAVYDGHGGLAQATFNEPVVLKDASDLIVGQRKQIDSLTDALRKAKPALLRCADATESHPTWGQTAKAKADAVALRALAEIEGER